MTEPEHSEKVSLTKLMMEMVDRRWPCISSKKYDLSVLPPRLFNKESPKADQR